MSDAPTNSPPHVLDPLQSQALQGLVSEGSWSLDEEDLGAYGADWTRQHPPRASMVLFPRSTQEVSNVVRYCGEHGIPLVPSGGRTGLSGGAVATSGEVVLSLEKMNHLGEVNTLSNTVRVQAGAVTEQVHQHCEPFGLTWPVDFASKGSSQVGGNIATNAGGVRVIRYGNTRNWVLGLTVVSGAGDILHINGELEKNNSGVDLRQLFIGSEGILGIVTEATLKLAPLPAPQDVMLFGFRDLAGVLSLFREARRSGFLLSAFEFFSDTCMTRVTEHRGLHNPLEPGAGYFALLEIEGASRDDLETWLGKVMDTVPMVDGTLAQTASQGQDLWQLREGISESLSATGTPYKNDISVPVSELEAFSTRMEALLGRDYPDWEMCPFGHIGDGNLHVNVMKPESMSSEVFLEHTHGIEKALFALVKEHRGSVSAEHGIGLLKRRWLGYCRSPEEIALMRGLKRVFDPAGILNPGKVLAPLEPAEAMMAP